MKVPIPLVSCLRVILKLVAPPCGLSALEFLTLTFLVGFIFLLYPDYTHIPFLQCGLALVCVEGGREAPCSVWGVPYQL